MKAAFATFLLAALLSPLAVFSQLDKGDLMNPFSVGFSYTHRNTDHFTVNDITGTLTDGLGIFVIDRLAVGPGLTFSVENSRSTFKDQSNDEYFNTLSYDLLFSPFVRYYFAQSGKMAFFGEVAPIVGYTWNKSKSVAGGDPNQVITTKGLTYGGAAGVGMTFFFNHSIGLETQVRYAFTGETQKYESSNTTSESHPTSGTLTLSAGLNFYLQPGSD